MPVTDCTTTVDDEDRPGKRWGEEGECYPCDPDGDCTEAERLATKQGSAIEANSGNMATTNAPAQGPPFSIILAYEGIVTGDDRAVEPNGWSWPKPPIPLRYVEKDVGGHDGAVAVGIIEEISRVPLADIGAVTEDLVLPGVDPVAIVGRGHFDISPIALEAARQAEAGVKRGVSVDPARSTITMMLMDADGNILDPSAVTSMQDQMEFMESGGRVIKHYLESRIRAATLVDIPAFEDSMILSVGGVTDAEVDQDNLTAAAVTHSGSMIALVPQEDALSRLAVDGYEPPEALHVTLAFLGEAESIPEETRAAIIETAKTQAEGASAVDGMVWASALFNPNGENGQEPATVYLVGGEELDSIHQQALEILNQVPNAPEQHSPWIPHLTIGYNDLPVDSLTEFGPVTFDRLRVSFAGEATDFQLGSPAASGVGDDPIVAAAIPPHSTSVAPRGKDWDGNAAEKAMPTGQTPKFYRQFYAYQAPDTDGTAKDHWHYLHHFVKGQGSEAVAGEASPEACTAIIQLVNGARGVNLQVKGADRETVYNHAAKHLKDAGEDVPPIKPETKSKPVPQGASSTTETPMTLSVTPTCDEFFAEHVSSLTASSEFQIPTVPAEHFEPIDFTQETPLTVTEDGRVYGHIASDKICHVGMPTCVTMPKSSASLRYFHTGLVRLDDGTDLATGRITMKGGHADINLDWQRAVAHYDDVTTAVSDVVAWEDDYGIAVTGHIRPGTTPEMIAAFRGSTPSGDWRRIGHAAELINVHMVNSPGFPIYRVDELGLAASIVASAAPAQFEQTTFANLDASVFSDEVAAKVIAYLDATKRVEEIMATTAPHRELRASVLARKYLAEKGE